MDGVYGVGISISIFHPSICAYICLSPDPLSLRCTVALNRLASTGLVSGLIGAGFLFFLSFFFFLFLCDHVNRAAVPVLFLRPDKLATMISVESGVGLPGLLSFSMGSYSGCLAFIVAKSISSSFAWLIIFMYLSDFNLLEGNLYASYAVVIGTLFMLRRCLDVNENLSFYYLYSY